MVTREEILGELMSREIRSVTEIHNKTDGSKESLRSILYFLKSFGLIKNVERGKYKITEDGEKEYERLVVERQTKELKKEMKIEDQ